MSSSRADSSTWNLDYSDIMDIFKNNLKIENSIKSIQSIFLNKRFLEKINYKPYFQRNYVWDKEKASYFIESILLGTEIPPLVLFKGTTPSTVNNEVIDGRQRFETLLNFLNSELVLQSSGLHRLYTFSGYKYVDFDEDTVDLFNNTKLRILQCSVSNEPALTPEKEDKIKKEIFKRYNSGITPLKKEENSRAEFMDDPITVDLKKCLETESKFYENVEDLFLPRSKQNAEKRDRINILVDKIRTLLALTEVPIYDYAKSSRRYDIVRHFYIALISPRDPATIVQQFKIVVNLLTVLKNKLEKNAIYNNILLYESLCWGLLIVLNEGNLISEENIIRIAYDIKGSAEIPVFWNQILNDTKNPEAIFEPTGSHYRNSTIDRYRYISNYLGYKLQLNFNPYMKDADKFSQVMEQNIARAQLTRLKLIKPDPVSVTIDDILADMSHSKFLVRPKYQRSEVKNIPKSSYLLESIMLGIKIPPIYIYKRKDKVKEVIDGQQRILTLLGFLGKTYIDENGKSNISNKHKFKLSGLKILKELNGRNVDMVAEKYPNYIDNILDFSIDVVEIDEMQNSDFNSIDLFLRLNTKPFPIKPNTFEMWNAYVEQAITNKIKNLADTYEGKIFRAKDTRMSNEELITALSYLSYQKKYLKVRYEDLLTVYLRNNHICARISSKDRITKMLENLTQQGIQNFESSIDDVADFISKICAIVGSNGEKLFSLLGTTHKTDQNFYFLWLILEDVSIENTISSRHTIFKELQEVFKTVLDAPSDLNIPEFINHLPIIL